MDLKFRKVHIDSRFKSSGTHSDFEYTLAETFPENSGASGRARNKGNAEGFRKAPVLGPPDSGLNTRAGDLLSVRAKGMSQDNTINGAGRCYITLINESIVELREGSVRLLD